MQRTITNHIQNVILRPRDLNEGVSNRVLLYATKRMVEKKVINDWCIFEVTKIVGTTDPIHNKESEFAEFYANVIYEAKAVLLEDYHVISYGCPFRVTPENGLLVTVPEYNMRGIIPKDKVAASDEIVEFYSGKDAPQSINIIMIFHRRSAINDAMDFMGSPFFYPLKYAKLVQRVAKSVVPAFSPTKIKDASLAERVADIDAVLQLKRQLLTIDIDDTILFFTEMLAVTVTQKDFRKLTADFLNGFLNDEGVNPKDAEATAIAKLMKHGKIDLFYTPPTTALDEDRLVQLLNNTERMLADICASKNNTISFLPCFPGTKLCEQLISVLTTVAKVFLIYLPVIPVNSFTCIIAVLERTGSSPVEIGKDVVSLWKIADKKSMHTIDGFNFESMSRIIDFMSNMRGTKKMFRERIPKMDNPLYTIYMAEKDKALERLVEGMKEDT